jgi:hypothetical protein
MTIGGTFSEAIAQEDDSSSFHSKFFTHSTNNYLTMTDYDSNTKENENIMTARIVSGEWSPK